MGSSGSAAVYCLKKFKENYLKDKERIDEELREEYDIEIDLGDITDLSCQEIYDKLFGKCDYLPIKFFNESLILYGKSYDNNSTIVEISILKAANAEIASTTIY